MYAFCMGICDAHIFSVWQTVLGLVDLVVIHSAAGAKGPVFKFPVARAYLIFIYRASTLAGKQCWIYAVQLHTCGLVYLGCRLGVR